MILGFLKRRRRRRLRAQPFPPAWRSIITDNLSIFRRLPPEDQIELLGHVQVSLREKHFEGCGGLVLTDEIRVTIATQACILLLHRETDYYPKLTSVLVYPAGFTLPMKRGRLRVMFGRKAAKIGLVKRGAAWDRLCSPGMM